MAEREDWFADREGNLRAPDQPLKPPTDEFGRDDPESIEREQRRRQREARRKGSRKASSDGSGGGIRSLLGRRGRKDAPPEPPPQRRGRPATAEQEQPVAP